MLFGRDPRRGFPGAGGRPRQAEILAQRLAGIILVEQAAALQFGNDEIDEIFESTGEIRRKDVESVRRTRDEPFFQRIGDALWRAVRPERAIGGVFWPACSVPAPGVVRLLTGAGRGTVFGEPDGSTTSRLEALAADGRIELLKVQRMKFGSMYHEGYSIVVWRPA